MSRYAIGLMSGTSFDGVDAVIFDVKQRRLVRQHFIQYSKQLKLDCEHCCQAENISFDFLASLTNQITEHYIEAVQGLLTDFKALEKVLVIGAHGQTVHHSPGHSEPYTVQLINASRLATVFNKPVVCDFRSNDIALGGQGAPLAPVFHHFLFSLNEQTIILNLGGIANITYLDHNNQLRGFDTGPANCLMDAWSMLSVNKPFDEGGVQASKGRVLQDLLSRLLQHPFLSQPYPKSADKEIFSLGWLETLLSEFSYRAEDIQATLLELTSRTIIDALFKVKSNCNKLIVCGGGVHNSVLMERLAESVSTVITSDQLGYPADYIEAMMIAWLAVQRFEQIPLDFSTVTGASRPTLLGAIYGA